MTSIPSSSQLEVRGQQRVSTSKCGIRLPFSTGISPRVFYFILLFFYCYSVTIVCIFFPSLHPIPANPTSLPHLSPPLWFCPCVLYSSSCKPLSPLSPPHSPVAIVTSFLISMTLVIFCLLFSFVDYVPVKGEIIWYLSLPAFISLSIMLSSSIQAVAKGIWTMQNCIGLKLCNEHLGNSARLTGFYYYFYSLFIYLSDTIFLLFFKK